MIKHLPKKTKEINYTKKWRFTNCKIFRIDFAFCLSTKLKRVFLWDKLMINKLYSWSQTRIFAASTITQYWLDNTTITIFFSDNATIIYWMKETNSCFLRIASKAPVRIQQNLYTAFEWIWRSNLQNFIFSWRVLREKKKIKVSSV